MPRRGLLSHRMYHRCSDCGGWTTGLGDCGRCRFKRALPPLTFPCAGGCDELVEFEGSICLHCAATDVAFVKAFSWGAK